MNRTGIVTWVVLMGILVTVGMAPAGQNGNGAFSGQQVLTTAEEAHLVFLREEEKLARDVYLYLFDLWGQWVFENISDSEQQHMDAVKNLLDKYNLSDPVADKMEGEFLNGDLQDLYDELIAIGSESKLDALYVGATIEDMDIVDLEQVLEDTEKPDITKVCENLMKGSRNHLRAFAGQIELLGETYAPQYLTPEEYYEIVNSPREN